MKSNSKLSALRFLKPTTFKSTFKFENCIITFPKSKVKVKVVGVKNFKADNFQINFQKKNYNGKTKVKVKILNVRTKTFKLNGT